jgi:hypothetical protein
LTPAVTLQCNDKATHTTKSSAACHLNVKARQVRGTLAHPQVSF